MSRRCLREKGMIEFTCDLLACNKNLTDEEKQKELDSGSLQKEAIQHLNIIDLSNRLYERSKGWKNDLERFFEAKKIFESIPEELKQNVVEWLDNEPLSDIKVHGISVNDVFSKFDNRPDVNFISVIKCFSSWKETNYEDPNFCYRYFSF